MTMANEMDWLPLSSDQNIMFFDMKGEVMRLAYYVEISGPPFREIMIRVLNVVPGYVGILELSDLDRARWTHYKFRAAWAQGKPLTEKEAQVRMMLS